jgi:hypothetical protein
MIAVLVRDEDSVHVLRLLASKRREPPEHFLPSKPGINEESGATGFEQCGIARAARGENRNAKRDAPVSRLRMESLQTG